MNRFYLYKNIKTKKYFVENKLLDVTEPTFSLNYHFDSLSFDSLDDAIEFLKNDCNHLLLIGIFSDGVFTPIKDFCEGENGKNND